MNTMFPKFSKKRDGVNFVNEQKLLQNTEYPYPEF